MSALLIASLSFVPGLGHWVAGHHWRAAALFCVDLGIISSVFFFKSAEGYAFIFLAYLMAMVPAFFETYMLARQGVNRIDQSKHYVILMLFLTGSPALPLLWKSTVFSQKNKITGSIAVFILAFLRFCFLSFMGYWVWKRAE